MEDKDKQLLIPNDPDDPRFWDFWDKVRELTCPDEHTITDEGDD